MEGLKCTVEIDKETVEAIFIDVFQYSNVIEPSPMVGGHKGGTIAYPVAVVRVGNTLRMVKFKDVVFSSEVVSGYH